MTTVLLALILSAPDAPLLGEPLDGTWINGNSPYFSIAQTWNDPMGVDPGELRLEFRRTDGGYGARNETHPWTTGLGLTGNFLEGEAWCWRAVNINANAVASVPSGEACFRVDNTAPTAPTSVDTTAIVSTGTVTVQHTAANDALSGVRGYSLLLASSPTGDFYEFQPPTSGPPTVAYVGSGIWYGWLEASDLAGNKSGPMGSYRITLTVSASGGVPTPAPPQFERPFSSGYGATIVWDAGTFPTNTNAVVASFCFVDTGCMAWRHGFHSTPPGDEYNWLQVEDEGIAVARLALVVNGTVGPWSTPSAPITVDRTPPATPSLVVSPLASDGGPFSLSWSAIVDDRSGVETYEVRERNVTTTDERLQSTVMTTAFMLPMRDGRYDYDVKVLDRAGNGSGFSNAVRVVFDRLGPDSLAPVAVAVPLDGGLAQVTLTWSTPTDTWSGLARLELEESQLDGGSTLRFATSGVTTTRTVGEGAWVWRLRGIDSVGNVGPFSVNSNTIVVTPGAVAQGPSITSPSVFALQCGTPFMVQLTGAGDAPLSWSLQSGPQGAQVSGDGVFTWTPAALGDVAVVRLSNQVGFVDATLTLDVSCADAGIDAGVDAGVPDAGSADAGSVDAGSVDAGLADEVPRVLQVGCGCSSFEGLAALLALVFFGRRRARR